MFSGIIEATSKIQKVQEFSDLLRIWVSRPSFFDDTKNGDSIAVNGICLTVEEFTADLIQFALGYETLKLLRLGPADLSNQVVNLERSLRFGDRVHGHMVSGHVEAQGKILEKTWQGDSLLMSISVPEGLRPSLWKKGSVTLHGVSLTVNEIGHSEFQVCLIPETIKQTNLSNLPVGAFVNIETDYLAKALFERWKFWQKDNTNGV